jgi:hypothetical protein
MTQFGVKMNFLGIKQVLGIFILKINFSISFPVITNIWTERMIKQKPRVTSTKFRASLQWTYYGPGLRANSLKL